MGLQCHWVDSFGDPFFVFPNCFDIPLSRPKFPLIFLGKCYKLFFDLIVNYLLNFGLHFSSCTLHTQEVRGSNPLAPTIFVGAIHELPLLAREKEMSGHSKWSTIKRKKGAADAKRGKLFTKIIKEIMVAARMGGGDINANPRLRTAVLAAKAENMPKDNIDRAIKKGAGELEGVNYEELTYEGYGPGGVAMMVEVLTDNKNRTVADVRHVFSKYNGNLGENGCVSWMFEKKGLIIIEKSGVDEDRLMEVALEAGALDVKGSGKEFEVTADPASFEGVKKALEEAGFKSNYAEVTMVSQNNIRLSGREAEQMLKLMEGLEDSDDVQKVYGNFDIAEEEMERLSA
jgi:YebC/PmpR family DNA-binding regulatory protein